MEKILQTIDLYLFELPAEREELQKINVSIVYSGVVFLLSLLCRSIAYSLITEGGIYSWSILVVNNLIFSIIIIFVFLFWVLIIASFSKKMWELNHLLSLIFVSYSPFLLLVPLSLICYYLEIEYVYFLTEFVIITTVISKLLKNVKTYFGFKKTEMFILLTVPIMIVLGIIFLSFAGLILFFYGKI